METPDECLSPTDRAGRAALRLSRELQTRRLERRMRNFKRRREAKVQYWRHYLDPQLKKLREIKDAQKKNVCDVAKLKCQITQFINDKDAFLDGSINVD
jgi:hypothetical protein